MVPTGLAMCYGTYRSDNVQKEEVIVEGLL